MKPVKYKTEHLLNMHINFDKYPICNGDIVLLDTMINNGISKTIIAETGEPIAIISVMIIHTGVATIYIIPSHSAHAENKFSFVKGVISLREELGNVVRENKLRRIETLTIKDKAHDRWMEYLGFLPEGTKEQYGLNGEDFTMWRRLWV